MVVRVLRAVLVTGYLIALVLLTGAAVGFAARQGWLVPVGLILPVLPIVGLRWLRAKEQLAGWSLFTVWLGSTYLPIGTPPEVAVFLVILGAAFVGYRYRSTQLLAMAWFAHIAWDVFPRDLPAVLADLPAACMLFDGIVGVYLCASWRRLFDASAAEVFRRAGETVLRGS
ncbi:MAG: hypothetical protein R3E84_10000 [Pseudomonadales bacterium]